MDLAGTIRGKLGHAVGEALSHYDLFGVHGLLLVAKARMRRRPVQVRFSAPGFRFPIHLRLRSSDVVLFSHIFLDSQYGWDYPGSPMVIVDAGANIGLTSIFYANRYPQARVFAVEPEPSNFEMLVKNTASYANIFAVRAALWNEDRRLVIHEPGDGLWDFWGFRTAEPGDSILPAQGVLVRGITVSTLMKENSIDYIDILKLDIEGAEKEVFERPTNWIDRIGAIAVELHDRFKEGCSDAVFAATRGFERRWRRGETTFMARGRPASSGATEQDPASGSSRWGAGHVGLGLPLRIQWSD